jgi:tRNA pseudouridine55 synthase
VHVPAFEVWREPGSQDVSFSLVLTQNTFVRTIAHEFGRLLGGASHLAELRREALGELSAASAWSMDVFQNVAKKYAKGYRAG